MVNILNKDSRLEKKNYLSNLNNLISIWCITNSMNYDQSIIVGLWNNDLINNQKK